MNDRITTVSAEDFINRLAVFKVDMDVCQINKNSLTVKKLEEERLKNKEKRVDPAKDVRVKNLVDIRKKSASPTNVLFGDLVARAVGVDTELPISIKMFREIVPFNDPTFLQIQGLKYEAEVYKQIYDEIIVKNLSPNFASFVAYGCCRLENICMLVTERIGNGAWFGHNRMFPVWPLGKLFETVSDTNKYKILFQILYSIAVMNKVKIVHNDLHSFNILVVDFEDLTIPLLYTLKGKKYLINTRYVPYIFDWDMAYSENIGPNTYANEVVSIYNRNSNHRDIYTLFCCLNWDNDMFNTYRQKDVYRYKESEEPIMTLSKREVDMLNNKMGAIYTKIDDKHYVYKLSRAEFDDIVKQSVERGLKPDIQTVYFNIVLDKNKKNLMMLWNFHSCRLINESNDFPTAVELIEKYLSQFRVDQIELYKYRFRYELE